MIPKDELITHIPALRAYAISLTHNMTTADDLVQDTLVKAWSHLARYTPDTNMRAWLFTILRNTFYSDLRKVRDEVPYEDGAFDTYLSVPPDHDGRLALAEFWRAFAQLSRDQREALALITVIGITYEEAAATCGVAVGTIKSRVNRGRAELADLLQLKSEL